MRTPIRLLPALAVAITAVAFLVLRAEPPPQAKRVPWTTSRITGSPEAPPPYRTERVFPKLKFAEPVTITRAPGSERLFVAELRGKIVSFPDDQACEKPEPFLDLSAIPGHWRTYGLVFHPNFAKNRLVYACYVLKAGDPKGSRLAVQGDRHRPVAGRPEIRNDPVGVAVEWAQRRVPSVRPRRLPLRLDRRQQQSAPGGRPQHQGGRRRPARGHLAHRRGRHRPGKACAGDGARGEVRRGRLPGSQTGPSRSRGRVAFGVRRPVALPRAIVRVRPAAVSPRRA